MFFYMFSAAAPFPSVRIEPKHTHSTYTHTHTHILIYKYSIIWFVCNSSVSLSMTNKIQPPRERQLYCWYNKFLTAHRTFSRVHISDTLERNAIETTRIRYTHTLAKTYTCHRCEQKKHATNEPVNIYSNTHERTVWWKNHPWKQAHTFTRTQKAYCLYHVSHTHYIVSTFYIKRLDPMNMTGSRCAT